MTAQTTRQGFEIVEDDDYIKDAVKGVPNRNAELLEEKFNALEDAKGSAGGYASLDSSGKVPTGQLPGGIGGDATPMSTSEIDEVVGDESPSGSNALTTTGLSYLWEKIKAKFAALGHTHTVLGDETTQSLEVTSGGLAMGTDSTATGSAALAIGQECTARGNYSQAFGYKGIAGGNGAHAEGNDSRASNTAAHAEGFGARATGQYSHCEGVTCTASGYGSHAQGLYCEAASSHQHVAGKYNVVDSNDTYAEIVGNGSGPSEKSNARTLDWDGNAKYAGDVVATDSEGNEVSLVSLGESVSRFDLLSATSVRFGCFSNGTASLEFFMPEGSGIYCYALIIQTTSGQQLQWRKYTSATSYTALWTK